MSSNDYQVGGQHYMSEYQHWDLIADLSAGNPVYFIGSATAYLARWKQKDGVKDLQKALHYIRKLQELISAEKMPLAWNAHVCVGHLLRGFFQLNEIGTVEKVIFAQLVNYTPDSLRLAEEGLYAYIAQVTAATAVPAGEPTAAYVAQGAG